ncbi:hypothetical protein F4815DRAFT_446603 [Daldinia loculata]|nr:hypothetical protein F4815DRAFT_446603 [Daldinia loculata]
MTIAIIIDANWKRDVNMRSQESAIVRSILAGVRVAQNACSRCGCKVEAKPCLENKCYDHWKEDVEMCLRAEWCDEKRGLTQRLSEKDHFIQEQDRRLREQHDQLWRLQSGQRN